MESFFSIHAGQPWMDVLQGVEFAALRMWQCDSHLLADEDGRSVYHGSLGGGGASLHSTVWAVEEIVAGASPTRYVLLCGAYGRYLGVGDPDAHALDRECCPLHSCSLEAAQRDRDEPEVDAIMWRAIGCSGSDGARGVVLLHDRSPRYLRGNKSFLACHHSISVDGNVDNETTLRWEVVPVARPGLPIGIDSNLACSPSLRREIRFVTVDDAGNFREEDWVSFWFTGRSVQLLREELARRVGYDFTLCVRAGRYGRLTPLLINLARSQETLHIVLVRPNSSAYDQLIFPNPGNDDLRSPLMPRPDATAATAKEGDDIWNKRQIGYVYILGTSLAVLFLVGPLSPTGDDGWILAAFACIWGSGSRGLPCGMYGARIGRSFSRHVGHILYAAFSVQFW